MNIDRYLVGVQGAMICLTACSFEPSAIQADDGLQQGPENTFYVGGPAGGDYLRISAAAGEPGYYTGVIYYENGSLAYRGKLRSDPVRNDLQLDSPAHFSGFDGTQVIMVDGTSLIPLEKIQPIDPEPQ